MNAFHPDRPVAGKPDIASHHHPLIGPYNSGDVDVLEYHAHLMRLAGIDGIVADWYGRKEYLDDISNHRNTAKVAEVGGPERIENPRKHRSQGQEASRC